MVFLFGISCFFVIYTYFGYPAYLWCLFFLFKGKSAGDIVGDYEKFPFVSVVIAAHNEEKNIIRRLNNLLCQKYPNDKLEILVVSDGSVDNTNRLVKDFVAEKISQVGDFPAIRFFSYEEGKGKPFAVNLGVRSAKGEIIVFGDARQEFDEHAIMQLVENFSRSTIGCVGGELHFVDERSSKIGVEMGLYWRYEKWIRRRESKTGSVIGATGAIFAARKELYEDLPQESLLDDVLTPMNIVRKGYQAKFCEKAIAYDIISENAEQEWRRKVRTLTGNWQILSLAPWILVPWKNPIWFRYISHKIFRLLVPFFFPVILVTGFLSKILAIQCATFLFFMSIVLAVLAQFYPHVRRFRLVNLIYFFMVLNLAVLVGFKCWITKKHFHNIWRPAYKG